AHLPHRVLEDLLPLLMHVMHFLFNCLMRSRIQAAAAGHVQKPAPGAINLMYIVENSRILARCPFQQQGARSIAEQNASLTVGKIDDARHYVGANDDDLLMRSRFDELYSDRQRVKKARARGGKIESPRLACAHLVLDDAGRRRKEHIRGYGSHNYQ